MTSKIYQLETIACSNCAAKIEKVLKKTAGIAQSEVLFNSSRVKVTFDENVISSEDIKKRIKDLGYEVLGEK